MLFHYEQKRLFFAGGEIPQLRDVDTRENLLSEPPNTEEQAKILSQNAHESHQRFGQSFIDAYQGEPDIAFQYEPKALAVTRKLAAVVVRPWIDLMDKQVLSHVDLSVADLTPGASEAKATNEIYENIRSGNASSEDIYQGIFLVGAVAAPEFKVLGKVGTKILDKAMEMPGMKKLMEEIGALAEKKIDTIQELIPTLESLIKGGKGIEAGKAVDAAGISREDILRMRKELKAEVSATPTNGLTETAEMAVSAGAVRPVSFALNNSHSIGLFVQYVGKVAENFEHFPLKAMQDMKKINMETYTSRLNNHVAAFGQIVEDLSKNPSVHKDLPRGVLEGYAVQLKSQLTKLGEEQYAKYIELNLEKLSSLIKK